MGRRRSAGLLGRVVSLALALALALAPALASAGTATAAPGAAPATEGAPSARPTADPAAPTPSAPLTGLPPRGSAPDGSTVGGQRLATRGITATEGAPPLPAGLAASAWLVADATTGTVLAARDPHGRYYPASTLKTLTLLTLVHRLDPAAVVEGTEDDERIEGSRVGLVAGGRYPVSLLFEALVLQSGNDAANALARAAGGTGATVAAMNATAAALGAHDTVAGSPSGLDVAGQTSSAYDLALILRALVEDPASATVLRTPSAQMPAVEGRSAGFQIQNQNPLLQSYPGILGGKTGFTDAARHTFVAAAEREGRLLVVSVLDTENVPLRAADQAALLLDWGFAVPAGTAGVGRLVRPADLVPTTTPGSAEPTAVRPPPVAAGAPAGGEPDRSLPSALAGALAGGLVVSATLAWVLVRRRPAAGRARRRVAAPPTAPGPPPRGRWPSRRR